MGRAAGVVAILVASSVAITTPAFASSTLYVSPAGSDMGNTCQIHSAPCLTIGHALTEASGTTTIDVAAGTYPEQITVDESNVTIDGAGAGTVIEPSSLTESDTDTDSSTAQAVIVYVAPDTTGVDLENLTVSGADGNGFADPGNTDYVGVYYRDATGAVTDVTVTDIEQQAAYFHDQPGPNGGIYVATDSGATVDADVTMTGDTFTKYDKDGISCRDVNTVCTIEDSTVTGLGPIPTNAAPTISNAQNGIEVLQASATIADDTVTGNSYTDPTYDGSNPSVVYDATGLLLANAGSLTVEDNQVTGNDQNIYVGELSGYGPEIPTGTWNIVNNNASEGVNNSGTFSGSSPVLSSTGLGDGIEVDSTTNQVVVSDNDTSDEPGYGTSLYGTSGVSIEGTTADDDEYGIYVGGPGSTATVSTGNLISDNTIDDDSVDGIDADVDSVDNDNVFSQNVSTASTSWDCLDQSTGSGTAGTDNTWTADAGALSSPSGICASSDLFVTTTSLPGVTEGRTYAATLTATGGVKPYSWSVVSGTLPAGLGLDASTGVISGLPTESGTSDFTIRVTDATTPTAQTNDAALSIAVAPPPPSGLYVSGVSPTSGLTGGGTPVTIAGAGFTGATQVFFGATAGTGLSVVNDDSITVDAPPESAGPVDVTVTTPTGTSATSPADQFTYTVAATPSSVACNPSCTNTVNTPLNSTAVSVAGASGSSSLASTELVVNTDSLSCGSAFDYATAVATLSATGFASNAVLTVTETVGSERSTSGVKVCLAPSGATTGGFLRPCKARQKTPCVKSLTPTGGNVVAILQVPANDPRFWCGAPAPTLTHFSPVSGKPGAKVTLKGSNLAEASAVVIGGAQAVITKATSSALTVTVPSTAMSGTITVVSDAGVATSSAPFTVR